MAAEPRTKMVDMIVAWGNAASAVGNQAEVDRAAEARLFALNLPDNEELFERDAGLCDALLIASVLQQKRAGAGFQMRHRVPFQVDEVHRSGQGPCSALIFCDLLLCNEPRNSHNRQCNVEALADSGCAFEIVMHGKKVKELALEYVRPRQASGHGNGQTELMEFKPLKVSIKLKDDELDAVTKVAYLSPVCAKSEYDMALPLPDIQDDHYKSRPVWETFPKQVPEEGGGAFAWSMEVSPIKRPRSAGVIPDGILGNPGLKKLGLRLDPESSMIFYIDEPELIV